MEKNSSIIDISEHQKNVDLKKIKEEGIEAVFLRATKGATGVDRAYKEREKEIRNVKGLNLGAYHSALPGSGITQAEHFLSTIDFSLGPILLSVNLHELDQKNGISLIEAEALVNRVFEKTGIYPMVYGSVSHLASVKPDSILAQCPLWMASWKEEDKISIPKAWENKGWKIWHYTDGKEGPGPHGVVGVEGKCDRDKFNGTLDEQNSFWTQNACKGLKSFLSKEIKPDVKLFASTSPILFSVSGTKKSEGAEHVWAETKINKF